MSIGFCNYHGDCFVKYQAILDSGHVFEIKEETDLIELVKNALISHRTKEFIHSTTNLKDRNVYLIYIVLPGGGTDYCLSNLLSTPTKINVKVTELAFPGVGGTCDMKAKAFILSSPKNYVKENVNVAFENIKMYSEPEFEGFVNLEAADVELNKDSARIDLPEFAKIKALHMPEADLRQQKWFQDLDLTQKELIWRCREGVAVYKKKMADLGDEKIRANQKDRGERFNKLKDRLKQPRCG